MRFDKTQPFISITAILAFLGVGVGVMVLIVAMAIMEGMIKHFEDRLFVMNYPITLFAKKYGAINENLAADLSQKFPHLKFSPFVRAQGAIKLGGELNAGIIYGVFWDREFAINKVLREGNQFSQLNENSIILGQKLLNKSQMNEIGAFGDLDSFSKKATLIFTNLKATATNLMPTMKRFNIDGDFSSGLNAYDSSYMFVDISMLQKVKGTKSHIYDGIHIFSLNPNDDIKAIQNAISSDIGAVGWWEQNGNFFSAIALEKRALFIVLMLIIIMASLNIISSLMMVIMTRRREIALLLSLGASKNDIKKTFFYLGNAIGISGIIFGLILSGIVLFLLSSFPIISLPADVYGSSKLPLHLNFIDFLLTIIGAILVVLASSYYPSQKAAKINPLDTLRSE